MAGTTHPPRTRVVTGPPAGGPLREGWQRLRRPFVSAYRRRRTRWLLERGVTHARRWGESVSYVGADHRHGGAVGPARLLGGPGTGTGPGTGHRIASLVVLMGRHGGSPYGDL